MEAAELDILAIIEAEIKGEFGEIPQKSARSIDIFLVNKTNETVNWCDSGLDHGERHIVAPDFIKPGEKGRWMLVSDGAFTGCEGWMHWKIGQEGPMVKLKYDNPWSGSNSYSNWIEPDDAPYEIHRSGGGGDNTRVIFHLKRKNA